MLKFHHRLLEADKNNETPSIQQNVFVGVKKRHKWRKNELKETVHSSILGSNISAGGIYTKTHADLWPHLYATRLCSLTAEWTQTETNFGCSFFCDSVSAQKRCDSQMILKRQKNARVWKYKRNPKKSLQHHRLKEQFCVESVLWKLV